MNESETDQIVFPKYFLSEIILTTKNGGRGTHFAKFLISPFQWGLTHSAFPHIGNTIFIPIHAPKIGKKI